MASRSPACLKSRGQNTVSSLQTNHPSLAQARKVVLLGRLDLWRQGGWRVISGGLGPQRTGKYIGGRRSLNISIFKGFLVVKMKKHWLPQFWLADPSSSRLPVARPRNGRIRLIQCQVGKVMLDQFTRSYAQTLDSRHDISLPVPDPDADV